MKISQRTENTPIFIESTSHDGRGIAIINHKTTFISGAMAQETVSCRITKKHTRYNEAEVIDIITPSPERITPSCAHFHTCGGCSMQHMHMDAQIQFKQNVLLEQLKHFGKVMPNIILPPLSGNPWNYRRKARLGVRYVRKKEKVLVGFREKLSNFLTDIHTCPILHSSVGNKIKALSELIQSLTQFEHIPQIEVAVSDTETALIFRHLTPLPEEDLSKLCDFAKTHNMHIYLQPNAPAPIHKMWPKQSSEKLSYFLQADAPIEMQFHPLDFIQINGEINQQLITQTLHLLDPKKHETILDLFCGLGNFTLPMARFAQHVTGIEGSSEMVVRAHENAERNHIQNVAFYAANLMEPTSNAPWMQKTYDKIVLDPPRVGAKEILPFFPQFAAKKIAYISCNPATLARDAGELVHTYGYQLNEVGIVNMFPHTSHIEAIALFEK